LDCFATLVERHSDVVYRVAARIVGPDEASDVSQDAFLRAFNRLDQLSDAGGFRAWLLQITHNAALSNASRRRPEPIDPTGESSSGGEEIHTPALALEQHERVARLEAKIRNTPLGSVKGRLHRARRELIDLLRRNTYDWELPE
jgi:RNA polymerase sigma-70 factor (ECF subfamily)